MGGKDLTLKVFFPLIVTTLSMKQMIYVID